MPIISVITPFLNLERYLSAAIESVRGQTFVDWEMILVDDGSSDQSVEIAAAAASEDPRIRLVRSNGRGAAAARNTGLRIGSGRFITFLDGDDLFEPEKFEKDLEAFKAHPQAMLTYGPTLWWFPDAPSQNWVEEMSGESGRLHMPPGLLDKVVLRQRSQVPCICAIMVRREALKCVGGFDESFQLYEDQTLLVKLLLRYPTFVTNTPTSRYRQHADSTSARATAAGDYDRMKPHSARISFLEWANTYILESNLMTPRLDRSIRFAFARSLAPRLPLTVRDRLDLAAETGRLLAQRLRLRRILTRAYRLIRSL
ncbi:glycosyltransferase involved in cell wall biosynthesis [Bradyrhizobium sp. USDA 4448]